MKVCLFSEFAFVNCNFTIYITGILYVIVFFLLFFFVFFFLNEICSL